MPTSYAVIFVDRINSVVVDAEEHTTVLGFRERIRELLGFEASLVLHYRERDAILEVGKALNQYTMPSTFPPMASFIAVEEDSPAKLLEREHSWNNREAVREYTITLKDLRTHIAVSYPVQKHTRVSDVRMEVSRRLGCSTDRAEMRINFPSAPVLWEEHALVIESIPHMEVVTYLRLPSDYNRPACCGSVRVPSTALRLNGPINDRGMHSFSPRPDAPSTAQARETAAVKKKSQVCFGLSFLFVTASTLTFEY